MSISPVRRKSSYRLFLGAVPNIESTIGVGSHQSFDAANLRAGKLFEALGGSGKQALLTTAAK